MSIETIIREHYIAFAITASIVVPLTLLALARLASWPVRALWRVWRGRRMLREHTTWGQPVPARYKVTMRRGETRMGVPAPYTDDAPAPDKQYQGDQVTALAREVRELRERVGKLDGSVQHLQVDTQDLVEVRSRIAALEGKPVPAPVVRVFYGIGIIAHDSRWYRLSDGSGHFAFCGSNGGWVSDYASGFHACAWTGSNSTPPAPSTPAW